MIAVIFNALDKGFTQFDPFEDTESHRKPARTLKELSVSPNSIRSRILKERQDAPPRLACCRCFTQFDPFEDTERAARIVMRGAWRRFHPIRSVREGWTKFWGSRLGPDLMPTGARKT